MDSFKSSNLWTFFERFFLSFSGPRRPSSLRWPQRLRGSKSGARTPSQRSCENRRQHHHGTRPVTELSANQKWGKKVWRIIMPDDEENPPQPKPIRNARGKTTIIAEIQNQDTASSQCHICYSVNTSRFEPRPVERKPVLFQLGRKSVEFDVDISRSKDRTFIYIYLISA